MRCSPPSDSPRRARCCTCELPLSTCLCALVAQVDNRIELLVLQHPLEVRQAKGTVRLLRLCLRRCRVVVGESFDEVELAALLTADGRRSALLYPQAQAPGLVAGTDADAQPGPPTQLVVLDGTWRKSLRMLMTNALLRALPRVVLRPDEGGVYGALRKARLASQLSTLEAACAALARLEQAPARYAPVLASFGRFVDDRVLRASHEAVRDAPRHGELP